MRLNNQDSQKKALVFACTGAVFAAVMAASLLRGMFFAGEIYPFLTVWLVLCGMFCAWGQAASALRNDERRDHVLKIAVVNKPALILLGCPLAIFVLYAWAGLRGPVSAQETADELLRWAFYATFALLAYFCAADRQGARLLAAIWHVTGMTLSLSALLAVCAQLKLPYAVAYTAAPEVSATGARLAGLLQYPNTFGAVMVVFLLERLFAAAFHVQRAQSRAAELGAGTKERSGKNGTSGREGTQKGREREVTQEIWERSGKKGTSVWRNKQREWGNAHGIIERERSGKKGTSVWRKMQRERGVAHRIIEWEWSGKKGNRKLRGLWCSSAGGRPLLRMLPLFPCAAALLLSESRGARLAAALASAAALLWPRQLCMPLLLAGAAPVAAAAWRYRQLARTGLAVEPVSGLLLLAGLWGAALLGGAWLCRRRTGAAGGWHAARAALAAALWTAAGSAVLLQVSERITGPSSTVAARGLFYRDAWKLAAEAPWLGRGGGTWRSTYLAAQSRPYVGSQVHSGYLDLLLNLGGVGLAVILLLLLAAGWLVAAGAPRLLPPLLALALHSAVDFDWSYGLVWLLLFLLPALARAEKLHHAAADNSPVCPISAKSLPITGGPGSLAAEPVLAPAALFPVHAAPAGATDNSPVRPISAKSPPITGGPWRLVPFAVQHPLLRVSVVTLLCGVTLALSVLSYQMMKGDSLYKQAAGASHREERISLLRQSLQWNPRQPKAAAALSRMLPEPEGSALLRKALGYAPEDAALNWELAKRAMRGKHPGTALYRVRKGEALDVFNGVKRVEAAEGMLDMSVRKLKDGDELGALQSADAGLELLREYRLLAEQEGSKGLQHNDRRFGAQKEAEGIDLRLKEARAAACYLRTAMLPVSGEGTEPEVEP
ncbi:hypothetical protein AMQ84_11425 [Paenibacillus riograndensis]|uniref:O-antigen ligase-related domain-containing protein n=1 Tax=Paenibacillus riograndensis TaxID=483937 RepID=A0A132U2Q3_9BACL|nr:O-antigen ligase family protein [Paenibacillus riograndensis]KWX77842.1 hypothetical protein AMQ84_11425 [Paenibacillus riograndensis]